jgi:hypothetical protein
MSIFREMIVLVGLALLLLGACGPAATPTTVPAENTVAPSSPAVEPSRPATDVPPTRAPALPATVPAAEGQGNADVLQVRAVQATDGSWTFHVTVEHPDTGWEDYADGWDVVLPDGTVLKPDPDSPFTRLLLHPHVGEQPFTRSQAGIVIPPGVEQVSVRAHDLVDGYGGREVQVDLTVESGPGFEVERAP